MKLSTLELDAEKEQDRQNQIKRLRDWRRETAQTIKVIDDGGGDGGQNNLKALYVGLIGQDDDCQPLPMMPDIHESAWPALRAVLEQTIVCIEADLKRLGVEIDEPALYVEPDAPAEGDEDDAHAAEVAAKNAVDAIFGGGL